MKGKKKGPRPCSPRPNSKGKTDVLYNGSHVRNTTAKVSIFSPKLNGRK